MKSWNYLQSVMESCDTHLLNSEQIIEKKIKDICVVYNMWPRRTKASTKILQNKHISAFKLIHGLEKSVKVKAAKFIMCCAAVLIVSTMSLSVSPKHFWTREALQRSGGCTTSWGEFCRLQTTTAGADTERSYLERKVWSVSQKPWKHKCIVSVRKQKDVHSYSSIL